MDGLIEKAWLAGDAINLRFLVSGCDNDLCFTSNPVKQIFSGDWLDYTQQERGTNAHYLC